MLNFNAPVSQPKSALTHALNSVVGHLKQIQQAHRDRTMARNIAKIRRDFLMDEAARQAHRTEVIQFPSLRRELREFFQL